MSTCTYCLQLSTKFPTFNADLSSRLTTYAKLEPLLVKNNSSKLPLEQLKCMAECASVLEFLICEDEFQSQGILLVSEFFPIVSSYFLHYLSSNTFSDISTFLFNLGSSSSDLFKQIEALFFKISSVLFMFITFSSDINFQQFDISFNCLYSIIDVNSKLSKDSPSELSRKGIKSSTHLLILFWIGEIGFKLFQNSLEILPQYFNLLQYSINCLHFYNNISVSLKNGADTSGAEKMLMEFYEKLG
ncbi:hypothetical protein RCL1_008482 [Eukaryota sp. TZLM3-RCL]